MTGNYHSSRFARCAFCHQYIHLDKNSYAIVAIGMHTHYVHMKVCHDLMKKSGARPITLREVYHAEA
jgi:hypothetical protein